mmetsp:Transcript_25336/g.31223  ORF Transcript_25336/g.31223 Transcript_25336/m.31223 type:complete len:515 (-) Transcript_25336:55-1599(-)
MGKFFRRGIGNEKNSTEQEVNKKALLLRTEMTPGAVATNNPYSNSPSNMAGYPNGAPTPMDGYHNSKHYSFSNNGQTSPSKSPYQGRESRSTRTNRSHQTDESADSRRHRRSTRSPHSSSKRSTQESSSSGHNSQYSPQTPMGATNATSDNMHHQYQNDHEPQAPMTQYNNRGAVTAVTPTPPPDISSNYPTHVSSSHSQGSSAARRPAYLLHRDLVIGKGSYGQVCIASRGESEGHNGAAGKRKKFACKCVVLRNDAKYIAKLQEEVNVLRELRGHENVIRLYDVFCVDNELFIITELGRGGDLFHLLTTHPKHGVTEAYAAKTVSQMLSAVGFLHARSICHRDLKLENWVLESGKDVWSPLKLIDFGLSTHFTPGHRLSRVVGSSYYVAPEVLKKSYTEACDLWSLGVIVYMLLSGAPPFYGKNDEAIKASIVQGEYTFPHELFRDVSDEAMAFVSTLLSYNIEYRYTAEQALTHPWLSVNCESDILQRAKDGARGVGVLTPNEGGPEPMQM